MYLWSDWAREVKNTHSRATSLRSNVASPQNKKPQIWNPRSPETSIDNRSITNTPPPANRVCLIHTKYITPGMHNEYGQGDPQKRRTVGDVKACVDEHAWEKLPESHVHTCAYCWLRAASKIRTQVSYISCASKVKTNLCFKLVWCIFLFGWLGLYGWVI